MDTLLDFPLLYLLDVSWPYWIMACVAVLTGVLTINSHGNSIRMEDCPQCGEPLTTNATLCETCRHEEALEHQGFLL